MTEVTLNRIGALPKIFPNPDDYLFVTGLAGPARDAAALTNDGANMFTMAGCMGAAMTMGLGIALGAPDREVVVIAGDGQMGLVMAGAALEAGAYEVVVWGPFEDSVAALRTTRRSPRLPDWQIPEAVEFESDPAVFAGADLAVNAIPTQFVRPVWSRLASHVAATTPIVSTAKGLETGSGRRPTEILDELVAEAPVAVLSGPTIAAELARRQPALMVAASADHEVAVQVRETFGTPWLRIYESDDPLGV